MSNVTLIPLQSIIVHRDGTFKTPEIGKPFSFTAEEVKGLEEGVHYRKPVVEAPVVAAPVEEVGEDEQVETKPAAKTAAKGGKKGSEESL